jgi:glycosyltransferase involved in cell wall biosynthesis
MPIPLVSIVVPSYNHGTFIGKMIRSVQSQTYNNWELIIVDNNSTDTTNEILHESRDKRISVYKINNEGIVAKSRNMGIGKAKGEWIAFLDSDDVWSPDKLENCLKQAENADLIYHDMKIYRADIDVMLDKELRLRRLQKPIFKDLLINGNTLINSTVVVRKVFVDKVKGLSEHSEMITAEDYHLWLKIAKETDRFVYLPSQMGYYTVHSQGLSQRDTSNQLRRAVSSFLSDLSISDRRKVEAFINYSRIRTMVQTKHTAPFSKDIFYCLIYGNYSIKIKSILSLLQLSLLSFRNKNNKSFK